MKSLYFLPRIFAGVGVVLLLIASYMVTAERNFVKNAIRTTGTVSNLEYSRNSDGGGAYYPIVEFTTTDGRAVSFRSRTGSNPPSWRAGEAVPVLYQPQSPEGARIGSFFSLYVGSFITGLLALIFSGVGFIWMYVVRRARLIAEELRQSGQRVQARVIGIERRTNIRAGRRHPWRIVAEHEGQQFYSQNIWDDPTGKVGDTVFVWVDRYNPKRYAMDLAPEVLAVTT